MSSLDLIARRAIATSIAYYSLETSIVDDHEFDGWCVRLHDEWDDLSEFRKWQLGDPLSIRASGFHIKATARDLGGVAHWMVQKGLFTHRIGVRAWKTSRKFKLRFTSLDQIGWDRTKPVH